MITIRLTFQTATAVTRQIAPYHADAGWQRQTARVIWNSVPPANQQDLATVLHIEQQDDENLEKWRPWDSERVARLRELWREIKVRA